MRAMASYRDGPRGSASCLTRTVSAGSYLLCTAILAGSKKSRAVSAEAKNNGQSGQILLQIAQLIYHRA